MILLSSVIVGGLAGLGRAMVTHRPIRPVTLQLPALLLLAFLIQAAAFQIPVTRSLISNQAASLILIGSQLALLLFVGFNLNQPGFWALGLGLGLNLLVIVINGGWMPITPETLARLNPGVPSSTWQIGERIGMSKDILIPSSGVHLEWLADRFLVPHWFPLHAAFSLGDIFIALGAGLFLWSLGELTKSDR